MRTVKPENMPTVSTINGTRIVYDQNDIKWRIIHTADGMYIEYRGLSRFMQHEFRVDIGNDTTYIVKNTGIIFDPGMSWEKYESWLHAFENMWTDDVWAYITELMREAHERGVLA